MRRSVRRVVTLVLISCLTAAGMVMSGTGHADARQGPAQIWWAINAGDKLMAVGANGNCRGPIKVELRTDPAKRGFVYATYRPGPFVGDGPGWRRNPVCRITVLSAMNYLDGLTNRTRPTTVIAGPRGGKPVQKTFWTGSGLQAVAFKTSGISLAVGGYMIVP